MPDRRDVSSWLPGSGPRPGPGDGGPATDDATGPAYPGKGLGRPLEGPGSIPGIGRRLGALLIDWMSCYVIALAVFGSAALYAPTSLWIVVFFALENVVLVATSGSSFGQRILGLRVETYSGAHPGLPRALGRGVLLSLAIPAVTVFWDRDQRGLHELATGTLIARR